MSDIYRIRTRSKLNEHLEKIRADTAGAETSLAEEVEVVRATAQRAVAMFERVFFAEESKGVSDVAKLATLTFVQQAMKVVAEIVEKHAKVAALSERTLSPEQWELLNAQVVDILRDVLFPEHEDLLAEITKRIGKLELPAKQLTITV